MTSPAAYLGQLLDDVSPKQLLCCSKEPLAGLDQLLPQGCVATELDLSELLQDQSLGNQRFDIAIVANCLEHMDATRGQQLLGRLRNLHVNRLAVLYDTTETAQTAAEKRAWSKAQFFALGLKHQKDFSQSDERTLQLYTYDIESYNHKRSWNNSRFWANPENFGKYWW